MKFRTSDPVSEFRDMLYFIDRLLLGLLDYEGPFIDARSFDRYKFRPVLAASALK
jgi:hypothetical protein